MSDHSKTEDDPSSVEQPSTSEPKEQRRSLELSTSSEPQESPAEEDGRIERLKKYRKEMAHSISIPDKWGKESLLLKDWTGIPSAIERSLVPEGLSSARQALVVACRHAG